MKMTRLEWRYLQKVALDHPYFDTHKLLLTEKEAKAIVEANIKMTGKEFVDSIYAKLGMTRPKEEKKRFVWLRSISELFTVPPIRKIAIAVLVVVLMTVFFAATPTGRAIAESVIHYIATLFDDGSLAVSQSDNKTILFNLDHYGDNDIEFQEDQTEFVYLDSFDDFIRATGKTPFVLPLSFSEIYYVYDPEVEYLELYSTYDTSNGRITTYQLWDVETSVFTTTTGYEVCNDDDSVFYSIEEEGFIHCKKILEDSIVTISSDGNYAVDDLVELLKNR